MEAKNQNNNEMGKNNMNYLMWNGMMQNPMYNLMWNGMMPNNMNNVLFNIMMQNQVNNPMLGQGLMMMHNPNIINQNQNLGDVDTIFESKSKLNNYFTFSLDKISIYYKEKNILENMVPNFNLVYNKRHESLLGNEFPINNNNNMNMNTSINMSMINLNNNLIQNNNYELTGKQEFKVKYLELYEITI